MVQWSSSKYENGVIEEFEKMWIEIHTHWLGIDGIRTQAEDLQICGMFIHFNECLNEVYEDGGSRVCCAPVGGVGSR